MKVKSIYIDRPSFCETLSVDDFLVAIGKKKSNSVYHIVKIKRVVDKGRIKRFYLGVINTDLFIALQRDKDHQQLIPMTWYKR